MKLVVAWLATLAFAVISSTSCSINHKSGDFECTVQTDCDRTRQCIGGYCIVPGGVIDGPKMIDAPKKDAPIDSPMFVCPPQCTSCVEGSKTCTVDCGVTSCTGNQPIVCPSGWNCAILCSTNNACANGVNCDSAKSCAITCSGQGSCRNIQCGDGDCEVKCQGQNSCRGVDCSDSCACDVTCAFNSSCEFLTCSSQACDPLGRGCSSLPAATCDTCP
ncbi:MAG: hypothetical protein H0T42_06550 [Deltaproteobacteria bacterium]|nr:hypothetical protein [Deltaproteobacteria bacterium]